MSANKIQHMAKVIRERNGSKNPHAHFTRDPVTGEMLFGNDGCGMVVSQSELLSVMESLRISEQGDVIADEGRYE